MLLVAVCLVSSILNAECLFRYGRAFYSGIMSTELRLKTCQGLDGCQLAYRLLVERIDASELGDTLGRPSLPSISAVVIVSFSPVPADTVLRY